MISLIIVVVIMICAGWMAWRRWHDWRTPIRPLPATEIAPETLAFEAFTHGNTCLAAGQFADATAAFERACALDPKRLHVAERLAEVGRRQHAASGLALTPVDGVPIEAAPVMLQHVVRWKKTAPG